MSRPPQGVGHSTQGEPPGNFPGGVVDSRPVSTPAFSHFFATLSLLVWVGTIVTVALAIARRVAPDSALAAFFDDLGSVALWLAWLVAAVTTAGSLYYSQVAGFLPCELCWLQRICMYPLSVILVIAAVRRDRRVWTYVAPLTVIGAGIAAYHTQLQAFPAQRSFCATTVPCTTRYVWEFKFVSLPFMALSSFCFVLAMVVVAAVTDPDRGDAVPTLSPATKDAS